MIIGITGHRVEKLPNIEMLRDALREHLELFGATHVIHGCANGTDLIAAHEAFKLKIPYTAAKPWEKHYGAISKNSGFEGNDREVYKKMIRNANRVVNTTGEADYSPKLYQLRNQWIVDNSDMMLAVWDGSASGTYNCVKYAMRQNKKLYKLDPSSLRGEYLV